MIYASKRNILWIAAAVTAVAAAVIVGALWLTGRFGGGGGVIPPADRYPVRGIDVSNHNGYIDFLQVAADGYSFVFIKATEGASFRDASFHTNFHNARRAGLAVGVYHFFRFDRPGQEQAINLLHALRGKTTDLPVVIDVEEWTNPSNELDERVVGRLREMTDYLGARGIPTAIYTNRKGFDRYISDRMSGSTLWICRFQYPDDDLRWTFWQYTHRGEVWGIRGRVDLNVYNGSRASFEAATARWRKEIR
ncbi:MAG: hypothetical protein NC336_05645 [Clostridium sp.]|nr:hypothetical protein [Clostridium sp.]